MFLTSAASKTKRAREESFGGANIVKHCVCNSLFKSSLSGNKHATVYITHFWWTSLGDKTKHCNSLFSGESNHDLQNLSASVSVGVHLSWDRDILKFTLLPSVHHGINTLTT